MSKLTIKALKKIVKETENKLEKYCLDDLLELGNKEEIESYINSLSEHGCQSGMVNGLIYYTDTIAFYEKYKTEINELLSDILFKIGFKSAQELFGNKWDDDDSLALEQNNQNLLAWFGYEETVRMIADYCEYWV